ncbi:MAG: hypothetical protein JW969_15200 [Spirochaetales bacterium]|nr:hypothetical protein [Spirochaetales bacterium]
MKSKVKVIIQAIILAGITVFLFFVLKQMVWTIVAGTLCLLFIVTGFFIPKAFKRIEAFQKFLAKIINLLLTWILLTPFYYICFTLGRLIILLANKDPMERRMPPEKTSYWETYEGNTNPDQFTRQF